MIKKVLIIFVYVLLLTGSAHASYNGERVFVTLEDTGTRISLPVIYFEDHKDDINPNYDDENSDGGYKKKLEEIVKHNQIKCLIDLHASTEDRPFDIDMGTDDSKSLNGYNFVTDIIKTIALTNNISDVTHNKVFSAPVNTVSNFISSVSGIPCVQLEINGRYRDYDRAGNLEIITKTLTETITALKNVNWDQTE